jgi:hypothetical protein
VPVQQFAPERHNHAAARLAQQLQDAHQLAACHSLHLRRPTSDLIEMTETAGWCLLCCKLHCTELPVLHCTV